MDRCWPRGRSLGYGGLRILTCDRNWALLELAESSSLVLPRALATPTGLQASVCISGRGLYRGRGDVPAAMRRSWIVTSGFPGLQGFFHVPAGRWKAGLFAEFVHWCAALQGIPRPGVAGCWLDHERAGNSLQVGMALKVWLGRSVTQEAWAGALGAEKPELEVGGVAECWGSEDGDQDPIGSWREASRFVQDTGGTGGGRSSRTWLVWRKDEAPRTRRELERKNKRPDKRFRAFAVTGSAGTAELWSIPRVDPHR